MGDTDYFAVFCKPEQHRWLEPQAHASTEDAARLADLLLGLTADGRALAAETYGSMQPFCQVLALSVSVYKQGQETRTVYATSETSECRDSACCIFWSCIQHQCTCRAWNRPSWRAPLSSCGSRRRHGSRPARRR